MRTLTTAAALLLAICQQTEAGYLSVVKNNGEFVSGTGIPGDNFTTTGLLNEQVALKVRGRDTGQAISLSGSTYTVQTGLAANNTSPWWSFDYQFAPGQSGIGPNGYRLELSVDFDPTTGVDFTTISQIIGDPDSDPANSWDDGDGFFLNPGDWIGSSPYVVSNSWHYGFGFWTGLGAQPYDPFAEGEYDIALSVYDSANNLLMASTTVTAKVVTPEPSSFAMAATALIAGAFAFRHKRRARYTV